jgi:AraC-like DNA-binding protein
MKNPLGRNKKQEWWIPGKKRCFKQSHFKCTNGMLISFSLFLSGTTTATKNPVQLYMGMGLQNIPSHAFIITENAKNTESQALPLNNDSLMSFLSDTCDPAIFLMRIRASKNPIKHYSNIIHPHLAYHNRLTSYCLQNKDETILSVFHDLRDKEAHLQNQKLQIKRQKSLIRSISILFSITFLTLVFSFLFSPNKHKKPLSLCKIIRRACGLKSSLFTGNSPKAASSGKSEKYQQIFNEILRLFEKDKIYLNPALSIYKLSEKLNTNEKYISMAIHEGSKMNFPKFLNTYRVNEAKRLMKAPSHERLSLEQIRIKSGFYSRSTFNCAFKNNTGTTPGQYNCFPKSAQQFPKSVHRFFNLPLTMLFLY